MYSQIAQNKYRTWGLVVAMTGLVFFLATVLGRAFGVDLQSALIGAAMFSAVYGSVSYFASDRIALATAGATPISKAEAPELYNIVENLCIADGLPTPAIYIVNDPSPNAFATGRDPQHASIAFTTGILQLLDKKELEGVAAHELSHVKNYDIRVMTVVVVLVGAVVLLADIMLRVRPRGGRRDDENGALIFFVIGLILAILAPIFAQLIQLAISRQREYLADASGALLTRYPEGLASALAKLRDATAVQPLQHANRATAHLYITNPFWRNEKLVFDASAAQRQDRSFRKHELMYYV